MQARTISRARGKRGEEVLDRLRDMAIFYDLKPGEKLNEAELAQQLGVSRTPVREALMALAYEGFLDESGRGYVRRRLDVREMKDLYELRLGLEKECCRYAVERASDAQIAELADYLAHSRAVPSSEPVARLVGLDEGFHLRLAQMSGNAELERMMVWLNRRIRFMRWISMDAGVRASTQGQHQALLDALARRDAAAMEALITAHISLRQDQIVAAVTKGLAKIYL
ncbi:FCD domain-containing protein [Pusillimonas sp. TS35]|jgi:DNA-binding GntR family transcriptional regulator|uniref:GntR family transcriptional regulator n=1 Tax=Paracandidimonas lactea TaxID=2895524 RepID=UPI00136B6F32|nr:GntR family transcriptional regulator [Paracandidimonas lactea]MYN14294.1 FCD domain-containing protein [Pusillimonas sp. TS35]